MICLPEKKVVVVLAEMQNRNNGASQGHASMLSLTAYSIRNFHRKDLSGKTYKLTRHPVQKR